MHTSLIIERIVKRNLTLDDNNKKTNNMIMAVCFVPICTICDCNIHQNKKKRRSRQTIIVCHILHIYIFFWGFCTKKTKALCNVRLALRWTKKITVYKNAKTKRYFNILSIIVCLRRKFVSIKCYICCLPSSWNQNNCLPSKN